MEGKIVNYRSGKRTQRSNQMVIMLGSSHNREEASKLIGKKVEWKTESGNTIVGKVSGAHGNSGCVLARFNRGLPGQSIGTNVALAD